MGRERAVLAKVAPKEKPQLLRVRSHDKAVQAHPISSVVFGSKVQLDSPAGYSMLQKVVSNPRSHTAKTLMREKDWRKLKFVFPETARGDRVLYARWCKDSKRFLLCEGGISYYWQKIFARYTLGDALYWWHDCT